MIKYKASGYVLGNLWMGGVGGYPAEKLTAGSLAGLNQQIEQGIADGSLDSGMGFNGLIGALMTIDTVETRRIGGKLFTAHEYEEKTYGNLSDEQVSLLAEAIYS